MDDGSGMKAAATYYNLGVANDNNFIFHMNGLTALTTYNPYISSVTELPTNPGFIFPFVEDLSKPDSVNFVPSVIEDYFFEALGGSKEIATGVLSNIRAGWGNIKETDLGQWLCHLATGIKLSIETGAGIKVIYTTGYRGFLLYGGGFQLYHRGELLEPATHQEIADAFDNALPHSNSLDGILALLNYTSAIDRAAGRNRVTSMHSLRKEIYDRGYNVNNEQAIRSFALHLNFTTHPYLGINAHNIAIILRAMTQPEAIDAGFPIHPLYLLSTNRNHRLWSAFGATAPTFMIPGGRVIPLTGTFSYTEKVRAGKAKVEHSVHKMHIQVVPLEKAIQDLDRVLTSKDVHSPIGTPLARKASTLSIYREFKDRAATDVLAALRQAAGVQVTNQGGSNQRVRNAAAAGLAQGGGGVRRRIDSAMDDI